MCGSWAALARRLLQLAPCRAQGFLRALLEHLRVCEVQAWRFVSWTGVGCDATHVERLFGFVLEKRLRCGGCGVAAKVRCAYSADCVLHLPLPAPQERTRVWTTTELCFRRCAASFVGCDCQVCEEKTRHREKERELSIIHTRHAPRSTPPKRRLAPYTQKQ